MSKLLTAFQTLLWIFHRWLYGTAGTARCSLKRISTKTLSTNVCRAHYFCIYSLSSAGTECKKKTQFPPKAITISRTKPQWKTDSRKWQKIQHISGGKRVSDRLFWTGGSSSDSNPWQHSRRLRCLRDKSRLFPVTLLSSSCLLNGFVTAVCFRGLENDCACVRLCFQEEPLPGRKDFSAAFVRWSWTGRRWIWRRGQRSRPEWRRDVPDTAAVTGTCARITAPVWRITTASPATAVSHPSLEPSVIKVHKTNVLTLTAGLYININICQIFNGDNELKGHCRNILLQGVI